MDPNPYSNPPLGYIIFGLVSVLLLGLIIYTLGAWGAMRMRQGRIKDETDIPFPERPRSADDRETVSQVQSEGASEDRISTEEQLREHALGGDRKIVPQTPTQAERPIDAADRDKERRQVGPQGASAPGAPSEQAEGRGKAPL